MKKRTTFAIYVTAFALLLSTVGIGYAWFSGRVETISESSNSVITKAANLGTIIFSNGNVIRIDDVNPGWCETKRVSIVSTGATLGSIYKINLTVVRNELAQLGEDLGYITVEDNVVVGETELTSGYTGHTGKQDITITSGNMQILSGRIGPDETHTYDIEFCFPELFKNQNSQQNKRFNGKLSVESVSTTEMAYCEVNNITTLKECLIRSDSKQTLAKALETIDKKGTPNFNTVATTDEGLYKAEDDYTTYTNNVATDNFTYYYRGDVRNNWVKFGDFLWRVIRINGDGSIRMIYQGEADSSDHMGDNATIGNASFGDTTVFTNVDGTKYSNGKYASTYAGYMYNPAKVLLSSPDKELNSTNKLTSFPVYASDSHINITSNTTYYFFKNFDKENLSTQCDVGSDLDESGSCILTCNKVGTVDSSGNVSPSDADCIKAKWSDIYDKWQSNDVSNGAVPNSNIYYYNSPYKYTCFSNGNQNVVTYNTTGVKIACPIVNEVLGISDKNQPIIRDHGLFSESKEAAQSNVKDSNIKKVVDNWYASNIYNKTDENNILLENYLSDEIFCNDRTTTSNGYTFTGAGALFYGTRIRIDTNNRPSFICPNSEIVGKVNNNKFTLNTTETLSVVTPNGNGNNMLIYPVGLINADEAIYAIGKYRTNNLNSYLYVNKTYWTMSSMYFTASYGAISANYNITSTGQVTNYTSSSSSGVRPVINLQSTVEYVSGVGSKFYYITYRCRLLNRYDELSIIGLK